MKPRMPKKIIVMHQEDTVERVGGCRIWAPGRRRKGTMKMMTEAGPKRSIYLKLSVPFAYSREHRVPQCQCLYFSF